MIVFYFVKQRSNFLFFRQDFREPKRGENTEQPEITEQTEIYLFFRLFRYFRLFRILFFISLVAAFGRDVPLRVTSWRDFL